MEANNEEGNNLDKIICSPSMSDLRIFCQRFRIECYRDIISGGEYQNTFYANVTGAGADQ